MSSAAKRQKGFRRHGSTPAIRDEDRIIVETRDGVTSIKYVGTDPETRYFPREPPVWWQIRESFRMGRP